MSEQLSKNFTKEEFKCPCGCGRSEMQMGFINRLQSARTKAGVPFKITSGFRCEKHNGELKGAVTDSAHTSGYAADVRCEDSVTRFLLVNAFMAAGFTRIGIAKTFIHVDCDPQKPQRVVWLY